MVLSGTVYSLSCWHTLISVAALVRIGSRFDSVVVAIEVFAVMPASASANKGQHSSRTCRSVSSPPLGGNCTSWIRLAGAVLLSWSPSFHSFILRVHDWQCQGGAILGQLHLSKGVLLVHYMCTLFVALAALACLEHRVCHPLGIAYDDAIHADIVVPACRSCPCS